MLCGRNQGIEIGGAVYTYVYDSHTLITELIEAARDMISIGKKKKEKKKMKRKREELNLRQRFDSGIKFIHVRNSE